MSEPTKVTDADGRVLTLRTLEADEQLDLIEACEVAAGNGAYYRFALAVASVADIDGVPLPRVSTKASLRNNAKLIRNAGMFAVTKEIFGAIEEKPESAEIEVAKN